MERQTQNMATNLPPNVFIHYAAPTSTTNNGEKSYYKMETIPFQHNTTTINLNQPISLINPPCLINQNNGGATFQTAVINNQCVTGTPTNYVSLAPSNWTNHGMQQVQSEDQMIYQIMYPIIDSSGALDGQHLTAKSTTVDANVLSTGTCTVLAPAKAMSGKKQIIGSYNIIEKQNQYTNTELVAVEVVKAQPYEDDDYDDDDKKKRGKRKKKQDENAVFACNVCGENFNSKGSLRFHMIQHNPRSRNKFQCIGCNDGFEKEKQKQEHELSCGVNCKMAQLECCFCDHPFETPKALRRHENKHRPIRKTKRYRHTCVCIECNKAFDAIYSLKVHIQKHHKKSHVKPLEDKPFQCSECGLGFKYERSKLKHEFRAHMKQEASTL